MILPLILLALFGGFYAILYYFNAKAPMPEGAKDKLENCGGCGVTSCELHPTHRIMEEY